MLTQDNGLCGQGFFLTTTAFVVLPPLYKGLNSYPNILFNFGFNFTTIVPHFILFKNAFKFCMPPLHPPIAIKIAFIMHYLNISGFSYKE